MTDAGKLQDKSNASQNPGPEMTRSDRGRKDEIGRSDIHLFTRPNGPKDNIEIPREEWIGFFDSFSRQHEGWLASVEVTQGTERKTELRDRPLEGISTDHPSARAGIYVSFERGESGNLIHPIKNPVSVVFRRDLQGAHEGIDITSADGTLTRVRFRIATKPELLDGVLSGPNPRASTHKPSSTNQPQSKSAGGPST